MSSVGDKAIVVYRSGLANDPNPYPNSSYAYQVLRISTGAEVYSGTIPLQTYGVNNPPYLTMSNPTYRGYIVGYPGIACNVDTCLVVSDGGLEGSIKASFVPFGANAGGVNTAFTLSTGNILGYNLSVSIDPVTSRALVVFNTSVVNSGQFD